MTLYTALGTPIIILIEWTIKIAIKMLFKLTLTYNAEQFYNFAILLSCKGLLLVPQ